MKRGRHVLFFSFNLPPPDEPGAGRPWSELELMREMGWKVTVITSAANYLTGVISNPVNGLWNVENDGNVRIIRTWAPFGYRSSRSRRLLGYLAYSLLSAALGLAQKHVDTVFTASDPPFSTPGAYLNARIHSARFILDERDVYPDAPLAVGMRPHALIIGALSSWYAWLRKRSHSVITVSPGLKHLLETRGAPKGRTFVLPNYFSPTAGEPTKQTEGNLSSSEVTVLYAGGMGQANDVQTCLHAVSLVHESMPEVKFEFYGAGERRTHYIEWLQTNNIKNVSFPTVVPREDLDSIYLSADIGIAALPAHPYWRHALVNKVFAYLAHGLPVVFGGEGDIPDVLERSGGGLVAPPENPRALADAILVLARNHELRSQMGMKAAAFMRSEFDRRSLRNLLRSAVEE